MNAPTTTGPKFSVGQKVFAVRKERMQYNPASPIAIGTILCEAPQLGSSARRYCISGIDPMLTFFEEELHANAEEAAHAVYKLIDSEIDSLNAARNRAIAHIEANA